jgi:hypothetical protein
MSFFDSISKTITQGVDRAKFEAEKFQRTTRLQGELNDTRKDHDEKLKELGLRAYELFRAGQIGAPSVASLAQELDILKAQMVRKEEELRAAQSETFVEGKAPPAAQHVPVQEEPSTPSSRPSTYTPPQPSYSPPPAQAGAVKSCPTCRFEMPQTALFCPNCGTRVG